MNNVLLNRTKYNYFYNRDFPPGIPNGFFKYLVTWFYAKHESSKRSEVVFASVGILSVRYKNKMISIFIFLLYNNAWILFLSFNGCNRSGEFCQHKTCLIANISQALLLPGTRISHLHISMFYTCIFVSDVCV